jgi:signal transduction histidine kinase
VDLAADLIYLAQVFANLLINAAKFTRPGGRIRVPAEQRDGKVSLAGSGGGIPTDKLPAVVDVFSQVGTGFERSAVGLTLVKGLAEMHGGTVTCQDCSGRTRWGTRDGDRPGRRVRLLERLRDHGVGQHRSGCRPVQSG